MDEHRLPVVGIRAWSPGHREGRIVTRGLSSVSGRLLWDSGVNTAECEHKNSWWHRWGNLCGCGLYACHTLEDLDKVGYGRGSRVFVKGVVVGWGRVVVHERGWRAQYAKPIALIETGNQTDHTNALAEKMHLQIIREEDVETFCMEHGDVCVIGKNVERPIWKKLIRFCLQDKAYFFIQTLLFAFLAIMCYQFSGTKTIAKLGLRALTFVPTWIVTMVFGLMMGLHHNRE